MDTLTASPPIETQATITAWATEAFGPDDGTDFRIAARANDELAELLREIAGGHSTAAAICAEAADVVIVLARLATQHGVHVLRAARHWDGALLANGVTPLAVAAVKHMAKLLHIMSTRRLRKRGEEAMRLEAGFLLLEVAGNMWAICHHSGRDILAEVDAKMAINRARTWRLDGAGCGYHVHAEPAGIEVAE
jgi:hypothetical protein